MNKLTTSHFGAIIAVIVVIAIMAAFATPFADYIADSSGQVVDTFSGKSNASLGESSSRSYKLRGLLAQRVVAARNQSGDPLTYDAPDCNNETLKAGLVAFTSGSVPEEIAQNAQILDVTVNEPLMSSILQNQETRSPFITITREQVPGNTFAQALLMRTVVLRLLLQVLVLSGL